MADSKITTCTICGQAEPEICPACAGTMAELTPAQGAAGELHAALKQLVEAISTLRDHPYDGVSRVAASMKSARLALKRAGPIEREAPLRARFYGPDPLADFPRVVG
jgi:hypothetical protein